MIDVTLGDSIAVEDPHTLSEVTSTGTLYSATIDESVVSTTDTGSSASAYDRSASDSDSVADTALTSLDFQRTPSPDVLGAVDERLAETNYVRSVSDVFSVADQLVIEGFYGVNDNVSFTDEIAASTDYVRDASDTATLTDQVTSEPNVSGDDTISVTDQLEVATNYVRDVSDAPSFTDQISTEANTAREASDTISVSDTSLLVETVFPADTISVFDELTRTAEFQRSSEDIDSTADSTALDVFYERVVADIVSLTELLSAGNLYEREFSDAIVAADTTTVETILGGIASDTISIGDTLSIDVPYERFATDTDTVLDSVSASVAIAISLADTAAVTDQVFVTAERGVVVSDSLALTETILRDVAWVREFIELLVVFDDLAVLLNRLVDVSLSDVVASPTDTVLAESIDVDIDVDDTIFDIPDEIARDSDNARVLEDSVTAGDTVLAERAEVDRILSDSDTVTDSVTRVSDNVRVLEDVVTIFEFVTVELETPVPVVVSSDGFGVTLTVPELMFAGVQDLTHYRLLALPGGVPAHIQRANPIANVLQTGSTGLLVNVQDLNFLSDTLRLDGGFIGHDVGSYIEILNGRVPGVYRIVSVGPIIVSGDTVGISDQVNVNGTDFPVTTGSASTAGLTTIDVQIDRRLPLVDSQNGSLSWRHLSAVEQIAFETTNKLTNQANYLLEIRGLRTRADTLFDFDHVFYTSGILGPQVQSTTVTDEGVVTVVFDQPMRTNGVLTTPVEYSITGPTSVAIKRVWSTSPESVSLETLGLGSGSYQLAVNILGTPTDVAGNPTDPTFNTAIFSSSVPLTVRSVFTDRGPIARPPLVLQRGSGASITSVSQVTLPGATLTAQHVGLYLRLGSLGLPPTTSSSVVGLAVQINDSLSAADSVKLELFTGSGSRTVYSTVSGTFKILSVPSSTQARLQASFTVPEPSSGTLFWELFDPRNGEIADDPSDVEVIVNGNLVVPDAVIGLLGQVVLPTTPDPDDFVSVNYSWCCNPTVEIRRLNSKEFRLNNVSPRSAHVYQYRNVLIRPSDYTPLDISAPLDPPQLRELHYRAYERAYTPVLNDPTLLLLNSPTHRIAYPSETRIVNESFVSYEATTLPELDSVPWVRRGTGTTSTSAGVLTVIDASTGAFPFGQPIFWTRTVDTSFPHILALSWRFQITSATLDGVFTGVAAGFTEDVSAFVIGFLDVAGVKKIGLLKRGSADNPALVSAWTGGVDTLGNPTNLPANFDWGVLHSYRFYRDLSGTVRLYVDGEVVETLRILAVEAPFLEELASPFDEVQDVFFGSVSRPAASVSAWDFVRYLVLPTNALQTAPSSFVSYEANVEPEVDAKPWIPIGFHGTETILATNTLLLDSTSATDTSTATQVGLIGGDFRGFVRLEPLLTSASQFVVDVEVQGRTQTHGVDPYGLMFAVDDSQRLTQVCFLADAAVPKLSYGGRSLPEDFSPYVWTRTGGSAVAMVGRILRLTDASVADGVLYFIEDLEPVLSDQRVIASGVDYIFEFRVEAISYTVDGSGFAGVFAQAYDGARAVGVQFEILAGVRYVTFCSDGVPFVPGRFAFDWFDGDPHTYRLSKSTTGDLVSLFIDGTFVGSLAYSSFTVPVPTDAMVSFGSATPVSVGSISVADWHYCNAWRVRSDLQRFVGIWKGYDPNALTGYHTSTKITGRNVAINGNALGDPLADFFGSGVVAGDLLIVDAGANKGVYEISGVGSSTTLTIPSTWPLAPSLVDYRILRETDWSISHKYRLSKDSTGEVDLFLDSDPNPLIRISYSSTDLPGSSSGIVLTLSAALPAIVFGSFSPENLCQSSWNYVRYGITRSPTELRIAPHHQVINQWNVMESPERLYTVLPHELTSFKSSSTGIVPRKDPDFLADPGLPAWTQLNEGTPLVPSTQTFETRAPYVVTEFVSVLNNPEDVLNNDGDFVLNDGSTRIRLEVPDDILYSCLDVIEQSTGALALIAPADDSCGPELGGFQYVREVCLTYDGTVLPENDTTAPTPWELVSDVPVDVSASVAGGALSYGTVGGATVYRNPTPLLDAPGLITEAVFRLRVAADSTLGVGDTQIRFGISAPGFTVAIALLTSGIAERFAIVSDQQDGKYLGAISLDYLDGRYHTYRIERDPGAGVVRVSVDPGPQSFDIGVSDAISMTADLYCFKIGGPLGSPLC